MDVIIGEKLIFPAYTYRAFRNTETSGLIVKEKKMLLLSDYYRCASAEHIFRSNLANARVPPKSTAAVYLSRNADKNILPKKRFYMYARSVQ